VVYRAIYAEVNARLQAEASRLGEVTFLNDQEARAAAATNDGVVDRPWELWKSRLEK
jgi:HCOMODA/2-hydroxy-3-carboxy-muconic semialdehyde decarboxylase